MTLFPRSGWRRRHWLAATLAWPLAACSRAMTADAAAFTLPGAQPFDERGPWDVVIASAAAGLGQALGRGHGPLEIRRWALPADAALAALQAQVQQALGADWEPLVSVPQTTSGAQLRAWRHQGMGRQPVLSLAWLDEPVAAAGGARRIVVTVATTRGG
ncbi:hypothetical protein [Ideonella sp. BN130291]|uniref:hypothetical protein n=1 Tax=Ideonella sp. BN130291 TaxID=3112940 RepID=UPI002E26937B|nr:hypothetical protein [Ideonella sp. BN130291]